MTDIVISGYARSPFHPASKGALANVRRDDVAAQVLPDWASVQFAGTGHFLMIANRTGLNAALKAVVEQRTILSGQ